MRMNERFRCPESRVKKDSLHTDVRCREGTVLRFIRTEISSISNMAVIITPLCTSSGISNRFPNLKYISN